MPTGALLPLYNTPSKSNLRKAPSSCNSESQLLVIVFVAFCVVSFGTFYFVPELTQSLQATAVSSTNHGHRHDHLGVNVEKDNMDHLENKPQDGRDPDKDLAREPPEEKRGGRVDVGDSSPKDSNPDAEPEEPEDGPDDEDAQAKKLAEQERLRNLVSKLKNRSRNNNNNNNGADSQNHDFKKPIPGKVPPIHDDSLNVRSYKTPLSEERRLFVKKMMKTAWDGYHQYALGHNELMPISKSGHSAGIFGQTQMGATVVDALDTLKIMELETEFQQARDWVASNLHFDVNQGVSVFEICIRFLGGLLSAFAMTGDEMFKTKAKDIADRLLPAFNTPTGIPKATVNLVTGAAHNWGWASGGCSILSELGTMQLEFEYMSHVTGDPKYAEKVDKVMDLVINKPKDEGLYPNYIHPDSGQWGSNDISIGALGDSFYEYLLKVWVFHGGRNSGNTKGREAFDNAMRPIKQKLTFRSQRSNLLYIAEGRGSSPIHKMGHLACFIAGLLALGEKNTPDEELKQWYHESSAEITKTCHESYHRTKSGLGPETMLFDSMHEVTTSNAGERYYILRPEVVESYFVLWRMTHDEKYRDWAWEAVEAIEKNCRCGVGYCGIRDVDQESPSHDNVQQSFLLAETFKYLYLIFCEDDVISLDEWVFNTEAHPVPILNDR